jgi:hypothetical protein
MSTEPRRGCKPILEPILINTNIGLACRLVEYIDAMPTPMATRHTLRLSIKAYVYVAQTKLTHESLLATWTS